MENGFHWKTMIKKYVGSVYRVRQIEVKSIKKLRKNKMSVIVILIYSLDKSYKIVDST